MSVLQNPKLLGCSQLDQGRHMTPAGSIRFSPPVFEVDMVGELSQSLPVSILICGHINIHPQGQRSKGNQEMEEEKQGRRGMNDVDAETRNGSTRS